MFESIYFSKKKKQERVAPTKEGLTINRKRLERDYNILEESEEKVLALAGRFTVVFLPLQNNLYKVATIS